MTPAEPRYRRLPGRSFNVLHWDTVWCADDHLLTVRASAVGDTYRRFFFRDIEAIIVRPTQARLWSSLGLFGLGIAALFPLVYLLSPQPWDRYMAWTALFAPVPVVLAMISFLRGPTCEVRLQTAVQSERILALSRTRVAVRVVDQLRALVLAAQATEQNTASGTGVTG